MKKIVALLIVVLLFLSMTPPALAAGETTKDDYLTVYQGYKEYYANVYVVAYHTYNAELAALTEAIKNANFSTEAQAESVIGFLTYVKQTKADFFGNRETDGKSRDVVPALRDSIYSAVIAKDYTSAIEFSNQLLMAVELRVGFLDELINEIEYFLNIDLPILLQEDPVSLLKSNSYNVYQFILNIYQNYDINHLYQRSDDSGMGDPSLQVFLSRYIETYNETLAGYGNNALGLANPYSNKTGIVNWSSYKLESEYNKQALFISNSNDLKYSNSINTTQAQTYLQGTLVVYMKNGYNYIEIYYIDEGGNKSDTHYSIFVG